MRRTGFVGQSCCALRAEECGGAGGAGEAGEEGSGGRGKERGGEPEVTSGSIAASEDEKREPNHYVLESRAGLSGEVGVTEEGSCGRPLGSAERGAAS